jgi:nucleoside-triphosphatase
VNIPSAARVSRYGVDVAAFEGFLDSLDLLESSSALVIIDEIGKMECFSGKFLVLLDRLWSSEKRVIATIAMTSSGPMAAIRSRSDVKLLTLTADNRQGFCRRIIGELGLL